MRKTPWVLMVIVALLLVACGGAVQPSAPAQTQSGETFMLALPRIVIDIDENGSPSILGIKLADIGSLTGQDLSGVRLDKAYVDQLMAAGIQYVEVRLTGDGVELLANGMLLPHISWTDQSLDTATNLAALANVQNLQTIRNLLPVVRRLGLDVAVRFPRAAGVAEIPLGPAQASPAPAATTGQPASVVARLEVKYDQNGVPAILGISASDLAALGINVPLALSPSAVQMFQAQNIQNVEIATKPDGLFVFVNGNPLPNLTWNEEMLNNLVTLYTQYDPSTPFAEVLKGAGPFLQNADIAILMHFPLAPGAEAIPAKFQ